MDRYASRFEQHSFVRPVWLGRSRGRLGVHALWRPSTKLIAAHQAEYAALYQEHGRNQNKARRLLTYRHPDEYRALYLAEKAELS